MSLSFLSPRSVYHRSARSCSKIFFISLMTAAVRASAAMINQLIDSFWSLFQSQFSIFYCFLYSLRTVNWIYLGFGPIKNIWGRHFTRWSTFFFCIFWHFIDQKTDRQYNRQINWLLSSTACSHSSMGFLVFFSPEDWKTEISKYES